jgi:hypothetical protein
MIGCAPTSSQRKGDRKREGSVPARTGAWILEERAMAPVTIDELLERLLVRVPDDPSLWQHLAAQFELQLRFGIHIVGWNRGFGISSRSVQHLASMGVSMEFDLYAYEPES